MQDFENKMKLAQTNLITKTAVAGIATAMILGLSGCGNPERQAARQKFTEAVAAIKVRAQSSTYSEFRQAELDLKTSYEVNKAYLNGVSDQFESLDKLMTATDVCWSYSINHPGVPVYPKVGRMFKEWQSMQFLTPDITNKSNFSDQQIESDPDLFPMKYVQKGLTKISDQTDELLNLLEKQK